MKWKRIGDVSETNLWIGKNHISPYWAVYGSLKNSLKISDQRPNTQLTHGIIFIEKVIPIPAYHDLSNWYHVSGLI